MFQQGKQQGKPQRDGRRSLSAPAAAALKASSPQPAQFLHSLMAPAASPLHLCFHAERLNPWEDKSRFCQCYSAVKHPPYPTVPGDDVTVPGGCHHLPAKDDLRPWRAGVPLAQFVWRIRGYSYVSRPEVFAGGGEGVTSWWDYNILQTRAASGKQRCHKRASQHWYLSYCCYSHRTWDHVFTEHSRTFWLLPLYREGAKGIWESAAYISARGFTTVFCQTPKTAFIPCTSVHQESL